MTGVRRYMLGFLYRTAVCLFLFFLCYVIHRLWPEAFSVLKEKLFYSVNYGRLVKGLKEAAWCLLPK